MIKFSCKIEELKNALQKFGLENPEIEKDNEVASAVSFLLATKNIKAIEPVEDDCMICSSGVNDRVVIAVAHNIGDDDNYVRAVKELQEMIFGEKDK